MVEIDRRNHHHRGLKVESALDTRRYQKRIKVSDAAMKRLDITASPEL